MDCSSPMSARTRSTMGRRAIRRRLVFRIGRKMRPGRPFSERRFSSGVGPADYHDGFRHRAKCKGTALRPCVTRACPPAPGCARNPLVRENCSLETSGSLQSISRAKRARANAESISAIFSAAAQRAAIGTQAVGELREDSGNFSGFFFRQLYQTVIEIDRFERLDENRLARRAGGMDDAVGEAAFGGTHGDDETVVAQRDVIFSRRHRRARGAYFRGFGELFRGPCDAAVMRFNWGEASSLISPLGSTARRMAVARWRKSAREAARAESWGCFAASSLNVWRTALTNSIREVASSNSPTARTEADREGGEPGFGIGERAEAEFGAGAQVGDGLVDQSDLRQRERSAAALSGFHGGASGRTGSVAADDFFQAIEFEDFLC